MRNLKKEQFGGLRPLAVFSLDIALVAPLRNPGEAWCHPLHAMMRCMTSYMTRCAHFTRNCDLFLSRVWCCHAYLVTYDVRVTSMTSYLRKYAHRSHYCAFFVCLFCCFCFFGLLSIRVYVCDACWVTFEVVVTSLMSRCQDVMTYPLGRLLVQIGKF